MVCILLRSAPVRVHDLQAYKNMDVTRDRIGRIVELRKILLPFQTGFNRVNAAAVGAVLERIPGLEPSSVITAHVFQACDSLKLLSVYFDLCVDASCAVCHQLSLLGTEVHAVG